MSDTQKTIDDTPQHGIPRLSIKYRDLRWCDHVDVDWDFVDSTIHVATYTELTDYAGNKRERASEVALSLADMDEIVKWYQANRDKFVGIDAYSAEKVK